MNLKSQNLSNLVAEKNSVSFASVLSPQIDKAAIAGKRILVLGSAGTIGNYTVLEIIKHSPAKIVLVDHNENALVNQLRTLRIIHGESIELQILPLSIDSAIFLQWLEVTESFEIIFNFAASKHVRSERDIYSIANMIRINALCLQPIITYAEQRKARFFSVSTDKAADPANIMGATKLLMENLMFNTNSNFFSARFANVAFSNGSLLESWITRIQNGDVVPVPADTFRYFLSFQDSGALCAYIATSIDTSGLYAPFESCLTLQRLEDVLERVRNSYLSFKYTENPTKASDSESNTFKVLRTSLNTSGEKVSETFVGKSESVEPIQDGATFLNRVCPYLADIDSLTSACAEFRLLEANLMKTNLTHYYTIFEKLFPHTNFIRSRESLDKRI